MTEPMIPTVVELRRMRNSLSIASTNAQRAADLYSKWKMPEPAVRLRREAKYMADLAELTQDLMEGRLR